MAVITTRAQKGSPLTFTEVDANFTALNQQLGALDGIVSGASATSVPGTLVIRDGLGGFAAGAIEALGLTLTGSSVPTNGVYLPSANTIGIAAAGNPRLFIDGNGQIRVAGLGSAAAPAIAFQGDTNTGIYSPGADQVAISTNGAGRLFVDSSGRVGIGTSGPGRKLEVSDTSADTLIRVNTTGASKSGIEFSNGGSAYAQVYFHNVPPYDFSLLQQYTSGSLILGTNNLERLRITSAGVVGIGTNSPNASYRVTLNGDGASVVGGLALSNSGTPNLFIGTVSATDAANCEIWNVANGYLRFATNNNERLRITSAGLVGIGTTAPTTKLYVTGTQVTDPLLGATLGPLFSNNSTNNADTVGLQTAFTIGRDGKSDVSYGNYVNFNLGRYSQASTASQTQLTLRLSNGNQNNPEVDVLTLLGNGNVGIGTTSPSVKLEVFGTSNQNEIRSSDGTITSQWYQDNNGVSIFGTVTNHPQVFRTNSVERLRIDSSGRLGIGTSSPTAGIHLYGAGGAATAIQVTTTANSDAAIRTTTAQGTYYFGTGIGTTTKCWNVYDLDVGAERLRITSAGLVGIGTSSPGSKLDVNGDIVSSGGRGTSYGYKLLDCRIYNPSSGGIFAIDDYTNERFRIDSSGRLLVGTSSARAANASISPLRLQVEGTDYTGSSLSLINNQANNDGSYLVFGKSRGTTVGSSTLVNTGDLLGAVWFCGGDGTTLPRGATIEAFVDSTPGASDMPGRLVFSTTADGASSPTERMRISSSGTSTTFATTANVIGALSNQAAATTYYLFYGAYGATSTTTGTTTFLVYTNGNVQNTNNSYAGISDIKLKENIVNANSQWNDLKSLQVRNYNFKEGQTHTQIGLIAQEVEPICPGLVSESHDRDEDGNDLGTVTKSVNYSVLYMKAVKALQEAMERIEQLEQRLADAGIA